MYNKNRFQKLPLHRIGGRIGECVGPCTRCHGHLLNRKHVQPHWTQSLKYMPFLLMEAEKSTSNPQHPITPAQPIESRPDCQDSFLGGEDTTATSLAVHRRLVWQFSIQSCIEKSFRNAKKNNTDTSVMWTLRCGRNPYISTLRAKSSPQSFMCTTQGSQ